MSIITDIVGGILSPVKDIVGEVVTDPNKKMQVELQLAQLEDQATARLDAMVQGQIEVNKAEATNSNIFVAGWRPAVGWVGATGLAYSFVIEPLSEFVARTVFHFGGTFPVLDTSSLMTLITGMLGFGAMRSWEKSKGVQGTEPSPLPSAKKETVLPSGDKITVTTAPPPKPGSKGWKNL